MKNQFNAASLAVLSRKELLALLANLQGQFNATLDYAERSIIHSQIRAVDDALSVKSEHSPARSVKSIIPVR